MSLNEYKLPNVRVLSALSERRDTQRTAEENPNVKQVTLFVALHCPYRHLQC